MAGALRYADCCFLSGLKTVRTVCVVSGSELKPPHFILTFFPSVKCNWQAHLSLMTYKRDRIKFQHAALDGAETEIYTRTKL